MKIPRGLIRVSIGILMGIVQAGSLGESSVPIININPKTDVPKPYDGFNESHGNGMVGWTFYLLEPFTVTQIGWYNENADGLSREFQVGLWEGQGSDPSSGTPKFPGPKYSSLIGDPDSGLNIPGGTNAALVGTWRVVVLPKPLTLQPGFYELGGVDSSTTTDVIKYVHVWSGLAPPGSPLIIGAFFYTGLPVPPGQAGQTNLHPTVNYYLASGLELGPMLFGTKVPPMGGSHLSLQLLSKPQGDWFEYGVPMTFLLTWPTGTVQQADVAEGPYTLVTNAASPFVFQSLARQKFYRLNP